jgi:putative resolvase
MPMLFCRQAPEASEVLSDGCVMVIVVEHRDRLARFGVENPRASLPRQSRWVVVLDAGAIIDNLVGYMIEVLARGCARFYRRWCVRNRVLRAASPAKRQPEPFEAVG